MSVVAAVNDEARARGLSANALVGAVGPLVGGRGGGKDDVAQGGGTDASRVDEALALVRSEVDRRSTGPARAERGRCDTAYGSASTPVTPGSASRAATRPGSWRPRSRPCGGARATCGRIARLAAEHEAVEVVVGLPRSLSGGEGPAAVKARACADTLAAVLAPVPVRLSTSG